MIGRVECYEISGSIRRSRTRTPISDIVEVRIRDFRGQFLHPAADLRRQGPNEHAAVAKQAWQRDSGGQRDVLKLDALHKLLQRRARFSRRPAAAAGSHALPTTIGDGSKTTTSSILSRRSDQIRAPAPRRICCGPIPEAWFTQLMMYKGVRQRGLYRSGRLPFAKAANVRKRTGAGSTS